MEFWTSTVAVPSRAGDAVSVEVAETGARVIGIAARILFALGALPHCLRWGIDTARAAAGTTVRDPNTLSFSACVNVAYDENMATARNLACTGSGPFVRF